MPASSIPVEPSRPGRAELLWLAGAIVIGMILRLAYPGRMAIEHFDEGVYASNFWFGADEGYEYPARYLYAPPLLPAAIEWTMIFASILGVRPTGFIPMIPSLVAGLATIPSIWWVGRRWFGPSAGVVSAWLVAASDFHASYSRAALTDVPVCLFILWGTYFTWQALQTGTRRSIGLAALFTALAWWTKYNGWLPLAIGISGGVAWQLTLPRADRQLVEVAKRWMLVAGFSFLFWSPVLIGLQKHGGYAAVAANHRQYVEGFTKWPDNAARLVNLIASYDSPLRPLGEQLRASLLPSEVESWIMCAPVLAAFFGTVSVCLFCLLRRMKLQTAGADWVLLAWICGLTLATPCYHPYPRLVLPWMIAVWLGIGLLVQTSVNCGMVSCLRPNSIGQPWRPQWVEIGIAVWLVSWMTFSCQKGTSNAWEDHSDLASASAHFAAEMQKLTSADGFPGAEAIVYVYGAPEIIFHLRANGIPLAIPSQDIKPDASGYPRPSFLVLKSQLHFGQITWQNSGPDRVSVVGIRTSRLVALDDGGGVGRLLELKRLRN